MQTSILRRLCPALLIFVWTAESFTWQQLASSPDFHADPAILGCRLAFTFSLIALAAYLLPKWCTAVVLIADALLSLILYSYWNYFHAELLLTPLITQWREGAAMGGDLFSTVPPLAGLAAILALALKGGLLLFAPLPAKGLQKFYRAIPVLLIGAGALWYGNSQVVNMAAI